MGHLWIWVGATAIMTIGSAVQAATGIGLSLVTVPLLALLDSAFVPGPVMLSGIGLMVAIALRERAQIQTRSLGAAVLGFILGSAIGAAALTVVSTASLPKIFGAAILGAVALSVLGIRLPTGPRTLFAGGLASGIMGTMTAIPGPPISLVLQHEDPSRFRATIGGFFAVGYLIAVIALAITGIFDWRALGLGIALIPGTVLGFAVSPLLGRFLDRRRLRAIVLTVAALSATMLLVR
jgi:hypothetical protein